MAPVSSLHFQSQSLIRSHHFDFFSASTPLKSPKYSKKYRKPKSHLLQQYSATSNFKVNTEDESQFRRREALFQTAFATFSLPSILPLAIAENVVDEEFRTYSDDVNKFKISIPQDWEVGSGESNGFKSVTAFYPAEASSGSNVSVVITGLGPDFTRLESFGKVDAFAENLVSGLDRSWQKPPGVKAKLIDSKAANGFYYIEYTLKNPGESERHLFSVLGVANNGWYNRLYTLTGQFVEEDAEKYGSKVEKAVSSFRFV